MLLLSCVAKFCNIKHYTFLKLSNLFDSLDRKENRIGNVIHHCSRKILISRQWLKGKGAESSTPPQIYIHIPVGMGQISGSVGLSGRISGYPVRECRISEKYGKACRINRADPVQPYFLDVYLCTAKKKYILHTLI